MKKEEEEEKINDEKQKRLQKAYNIIESSLYEPVIVEKIFNNQKKIFRVRSTTQRSQLYDVDIESKTCSCPDFKFRLTKCKHILATEVISPADR